MQELLMKSPNYDGELCIRRSPGMEISVSLMIIPFDLSKF